MIYIHKQKTFGAADLDESLERGRNYTVKHWKCEIQCYILIPKCPSHTLSCGSALLLSTSSLSLCSPLPTFSEETKIILPSYRESQLSSAPVTKLSKAIHFHIQSYINELCSLSNFLWIFAEIKEKYSDIGTSLIRLRTQFLRKQVSTGFFKTYFSIINRSNVLNDLKPKRL